MGNDIDALIEKLSQMQDTIDDDVDEVLQNNATEFTSDTISSAKSVMNKGYWTGNLARQVRDTKEGNLKYAITSNAGYSGFIEWAHVTWNQKHSCSLFTKSIRIKSEKTSNN